MTFHEFRFGSRDRKQREPFNDWLTDLRLLAKNCEFGDLEDRLLRSRIILGVQYKCLQQKLIAENPSHQKTVAICRAHEQGKEQFKEIIEGTVTAGNTVVHAVAQQTRPCTRCGYFAHCGETCPALGKVCTKCGGRNHFARARKASAHHQNRSLEKEVRGLQSEDDGNYTLQTLTVGALASDHWSETVDIEAHSHASWTKELTAV